MPSWKVAIAARASADLHQVLDWTGRQFGTTQRRRYGAAIRAAIARLREEGPEPPGCLPADPERPDLRSLPVGRRARHLLIYKAGSDRRIIILRILHDSMDLPRHFPPGGDT